MKLVVFCTVSTGLFGVSLAIKQGLNVDEIISLHPDSVKNKDAISGYTDVKPFAAKHGIKHRYISNYAMKNCEAEVTDLQADMFWVAGWQRLLPQYVIEKARLGVIGGHGSCDGIVKGRGRSPQNWAIIMGARSFELSLFEIAAGIDNGPTIFTKTFPLLETDTIMHSYIKAATTASEGMIAISNDPTLFENSCPQEGEPAYFPKRTAEDGDIDWEMDYRDICNQVRALTLPYPCARTTCEAVPFHVIAATPVAISKTAENGQIIEVFETGEVLVQAKHGAVLIENASYPNGMPTNLLAPGKKLSSVPMQRTIDTILTRFAKEFPGKRLNASLKHFWESRHYTTQ